MGNNWELAVIYKYIIKYNVQKSLITFSVIINQALLISDQFDSSGIWENNCFPLFSMLLRRI